MMQSPNHSALAQHLARIQQMEALLDECDEAVQQLERALEQYVAIQPKIEELATYYESKDWRYDYESDENGQLPKNLKRGVLTEDSVFDLLVQQRQLETVLNAWRQEESDCG